MELNAFYRDAVACHLNNLYNNATDRIVILACKLKWNEGYTIGKERNLEYITLGSEPEPSGFIDEHTTFHFSTVESLMECFQNDGGEDFIIEDIVYLADIVKKQN